MFSRDIVALLLHFQPYINAYHHNEIVSECDQFITVAPYDLNCFVEDYVLE